VAYLPQIAKAARDHTGAQAISFGTWGLFLTSHASATAYALVNKNGWTMAWMFLGNAVGCGGVLLTTAWKRSRHHRRRIVRGEDDAHRGDGEARMRESDTNLRSMRLSDAELRSQGRFARSASALVLETLARKPR
jgi:hypothetical protein